jgi:hypothetical protein
MVVEAKEKNIPIGEMVSKGEVRFEARENSWKNVEPFHFPVFRGVKIKTEKGLSVIALENMSQIEMGQQSMISFTQEDQLSLFHGGIDFRVPPSAQMSFKIGSLFIMKSRTLQAGNDTTVIPAKNEEVIGSLSIHANGSLTVKSVKGELSILDQDHIVLASLPQKDALTIPSAIVSGKQRVMVAQAGDIDIIKQGDKKSEEKWRSEELVAIWGTVLLNAGMIGLIFAESIDNGDDNTPICR